MPNNQRIFYAVEQVAVAPDGTSSFTPIHGLQSVGITTTFDLAQVFEIGQIDLYDIIEQVPNVEITMEKVIDGYPLIFHLMTQGAPFGTLVGRSSQKALVALDIFPDTQQSASGTPIAEVVMSGVTVSSLTYTFPTDGNCSESVTSVCNNKVWRDAGNSNGNGSMVYSGVFVSNTDSPLATGGHVMTRKNVIFALPTGTITADANGQAIALSTILPTDIYGINASGVNPQDGSGAHIQSISISCDLGRDQIFELGRQIPYFRYATFPIEVTTDITVIGTKWDAISATETGNQNGAGAGYNLKNQSIRVALTDGTFVTTGTKNKLASVGYTGGDAGGGGGNVSLSYKYSTFNNLTVKHPADPTFGGVQTAV